MIEQGLCKQVSNAYPSHLLSSQWDEQPLLRDVVIVKFSHRGQRHRERVVESGMLDVEE